MRMKLFPGDLNPNSRRPHLTSNYICGMTIAPRVYGDIIDKLLAGLFCIDVTLFLVSLFGFKKIPI